MSQINRDLSADFAHTDLTRLNRVCVIKRLNRVCVINCAVKAAGKCISGSTIKLKPNACLDGWAPPTPTVCLDGGNGPGVKRLLYNYF